MTASQHTIDEVPEQRSGSASVDSARKQRLRMIVISVVAACGLLTVVGGMINLLSN